MTPADGHSNRPTNIPATSHIRQTSHNTPEAHPSSPDTSPDTLIDEHFDFLTNHEQTTTEETRLLLSSTRRRRRNRSTQLFHQRVRQLLELYLQDRRFLHVNPTNEVERFAVNMAEDLEDKENIKNV